MINGNKLEAAYKHIHSDAVRTEIDCVSKDSKRQIYQKESGVNFCLYQSCSALSR